MDQQRRAARHLLKRPRRAAVARVRDRQARRRGQRRPGEHARQRAGAVLDRDGVDARQPAHRGGQRGVEHERALARLGSLRAVDADGEDAVVAVVLDVGVTLSASRACAAARRRAGGGAGGWAATGWRWRRARL